MPTFADIGVSRGQRGGSPTVVNLSFLDRSRYFSFKQLLIYPQWPTTAKVLKYINQKTKIMKLFTSSLNFYESIRVTFQYLVKNLQVNISYISKSSSRQVYSLQVPNTGAK
jgi:hypothetical protein